MKCVEARTLHGFNLTKLIRHSLFPLCILQISEVPRAKLQLAGVTAMLIASKYEEMYAPEVSSLLIKSLIKDWVFEQSIYPHAGY